MKNEEAAYKIVKESSHYMITIVNCKFSNTSTYRGHEPSIYTSCHWNGVGRFSQVFPSGFDEETLLFMPGKIDVQLFLT